MTNLLRGKYRILLFYFVAIILNACSQYTPPSVSNEKVNHLLSGEALLGNKARK